MSVTFWPRSQVYKLISKQKVSISATSAWPASGFFCSAQIPLNWINHLHRVNPTPDPNAALDSAGFYFLKGDDVLLDIAVRRVEGRVLFSTRRGNSWGQEQSVALQGAFLGPGAIIHVTATATAYKISFNNSSTIHTFSKVIQGDATSILYFDNNSKPAFSNPVIAAVFDGVYILLCTLMAPVYSYTSEGNPQ